METCDKCREVGNIFFERKYKPDEYLEGKLNSQVWIIGINPAGTKGYQDAREKKALEGFTPDLHSYFDDFKTVSERMYKLIGSDRGIAHTDVVKCFSPGFSKDFNSSQAKTIVTNCTPHLKNQLERHKPKFIICNGGWTMLMIKKLIPPKKDFKTCMSSDQVGQNRRLSNVVFAC